MYQLHPVVVTAFVEQRHRDLLQQAQADRLAQAARAASARTPQPRRWARQIIAFAR
jgi:hypothetical protein